MKRALGLVVLLAVPRVSLASEAAPPDPVAIVCSISGTGRVVVGPSAASRPLHVFDWLPEGAEIELDARSSLVLAFRNGTRYELPDGVRARLGAADLTASVGKPRRLAAVPPLPPIPKLREDEVAGIEVGAIRLRGTGLTNLYPRQEFTVLADDVVLRFDPPSGSRRFTVKVEDQDGTTVFQQEATSGQARVPPGSLRPGSRYYWTVRTIDAAGWSIHGEGEFFTVASDVAQARNLLKTAVSESGDPASLALLAEIDRRLGLLLEARDDLRAALARVPNNDDLTKALEGVERRLATP